MSDSDDERPPDQPVANGGAKIISLFDRRLRRAEERAKASLSGTETAPPEAKAEGGLLAQLEAWDLDSSVAELGAKVGDGRDDLVALWRSIRSWRAVRSHLRGERDKAAADWAELIDEGFDEALVTRATYATADGDFAAALAALDRAAARSPRNGAVYQERGLLYQRKLADPERAIANFERAAQLLRHDAAPYEWMARVMSSQSNHEGAIRALGRAIARRPTRADLFLERGRAWRAKGAIDEAFTDFGRSIELDPRSPQAFAERARCRVARKDLVGAITDYSSALALAPDDPGYLESRSEAHLAMGAFEAAIADLTRLLDLSEREDGDAWFALGKAYLLSGDEAHAKGCFRWTRRFARYVLKKVRASADLHRLCEDIPALRADLDILVLMDEHDDWLHLLERARLSAGAGDFEAALADLGRVLEPSPTSPDALVLRAEIFAKQGRFAEAIADMTTAIGGTKYPSIYLAKRALYRLGMEGDTLAGRADLTRAVELAQYDPEVRVCRVTYLRTLGKLPEAMDDLDVLIMLDRMEAQHYVDRVAARLQLGEDEASLHAALLDLKRARVVGRGRADVSADLGRVRALLGDTEAEADNEEEDDEG